MKKIVMILAAAIVLSSCNKKDQAPAEQSEKVAEIKKAASEADMLEGKVVESDTHDWYVIKDGERYRAMSEPATTDYLNSMKDDGTDHVVHNVSSKTLEQFPVVGEILPKVVFKRGESK